jgi:hypothetical protein
MGSGNARWRAIMALKLVAAALTVTTAAISAPAAAVGFPQGHLLARDIGGVELGMPLAEVRGLFTAGLEPLGSNVFKAMKDGIIYQLEFTALDRLWFIATTENLGRFDPDPAFQVSVTRRLDEKYGKVRIFSEPYRLPGPYGGGTLWRETEGVSAVVGGLMGQNRTLEMTLRDNALFRRDLATANTKPKGVAEKALKF